MPRNHCWVSYVHTPDIKHLHILAPDKFVLFDIYL